MWKKIYFNVNNIEYESQKGTLIKVPSTSIYKNYRFWHPKKLIREEGGKGFFLSFSFTENWEFKLFKNDKKTIIDPEEMIEIFSSGDENIRDILNKKEERRIEVVTIVPEKIEKEVMIDEDLFI